jgi:hypothetical protein
LPHLPLVTTTDLEDWADRVESRTTFPKLVRRLIRENNDQVVALEMRADEGGDLPDYDGRVRASKGTPFVPAGSSVWELGTGKDPGRKASKDYRERSEDPRGVDRADTTFVFVTPRRWDGKRAWIERRRPQGIWRDVVAFDADDIETALELATPTHLWISELLGKPVDGVETLERWWTRFSGGSRPALTPELVLAGRADAAAALLRILTGSAQLATISGPSSDDVLAFAASTILTAKEPTSTDLVTKSLVVRDVATLRWLERTGNQLVLFPIGDGLRREAELVQNHHVVSTSLRQLRQSSNFPAWIAIGSRRCSKRRAWQKGSLNV